MRLHFYLSHSFAHADKYVRLLEFMRSEGLQTADYSVPVWRQVEGGTDAVKQAIFDRIARCNRVVVLLTDGIHKSPYVEYEIAAAQHLGKPIIGVFPHGKNECAIPASLASRHYRMIGWRSESLGKAMRGEYPPESRVFDIAELEDRHDMIVRVGGATAALSFFVAGWAAGNWMALRRELGQQAITVVGDEGPSLLGTVVKPAAVGMLVGAVLGATIGKTEKAAFAAAIAGAGVGIGLGATRFFTLRTKALGSITQLTLAPVSAVSTTGEQR